MYSPSEYNDITWQYVSPRWELICFSITIYAYSRWKLYFGLAWMIDLGRLCIYVYFPFRSHIK
jgi:hypothetical protein